MIQFSGISWDENTYNSNFTCEIIEKKVKNI